MNKVLPVLALTLLPLTAAAQTPADENRFQIERNGEQIIRLDRKTGAISTCSLTGDQLDCRMSADERAALEAEIERLSAELEELKAKPGTAEADGRTVTLKLPTEAELRSMLGYIEEAFRKIVDAVVGLTKQA